MDDMTRHMLELQREQEEHPERFTYTTICDGCGDRQVCWTNKEEIEKWRKQHPGQDKAEIHTWGCEKCSREEDDD